MRRRKNTRPTHIYWLIDTRPETLASGWPNGLPFYCGKSVRPIGRLQEHKKSAADGKSSRPVLLRVRDCGEHVRLHVIEIVPVGGDWVASEKRWIAFGRRTFPDFCNVADGGAGVPGYIPTEQQRRNIGAATRARSQNPDYIARLSAAHKGRKLSPEHRAQCAAHLRALHQEESYILRNTAQTKARWADPDYRARMTQIATGRKLSAEAREKIAASKRGKPLSAEHKAKIGAAHKGKTISEAQRRAVSAALKGKSRPKTEADKAALRAGWQRRRERLAAEADANV